jgi:hypothetical protein
MAGVDVKRTKQIGMMDVAFGLEAPLQGVASGTTAVRAITVIPFRARNSLHPRF